jgi:hypothetical protein
MAIPLLGEALTTGAALGVVLTSLGALMGALSRTPSAGDPAKAS